MNTENQQPEENNEEAPITGDQTSTEQETIIPADSLPEQTPEHVEYESNKAKFAELYAKWNTMSESEKDDDQGKIMRIDLTELSQEIKKYEAGNDISDEELEEEIDEVNEEPAAPQYDYTGKVRLSQHEHDAFDKEKAIDLVKKSGVYEHYKGILINEIENDCLSAAYSNMLRMIISADAQGQVYSGTL